jgi:hypothetical protein
MPAPSTPTVVRNHIGWHQHLARLRGSGVRFDLSAYDESLTDINRQESELRSFSNAVRNSW